MINNDEVDQHQNNQINDNIQELESQKAINDQQTNQINQNSQDISNVADGSSPKIAELIRKMDIMSTCKNSAQHDLGLGNSDSRFYGRYVGNCNTGDIFTPSGCSFQCRDPTDSWVTCASVQCEFPNGSGGKWASTSGRICCASIFGMPDGCCN